MSRLALGAILKRISNLYDTICSFENIYEAYKSARKCKRYRREVLNFTANLESNLINIQQELLNKTYTVGEYREFYVYDPKKRLIMALPFRDRVVQWAIYRQLNPLLNKRYIAHSYACRTGYGSHKAVKRVQYWLQKQHRQHQYVYVLKMDIAKYFYRVDQNILLTILSNIIKDKDLLKLLETIVQCSIHTGLEISDSLLNGNRIYGVGMPIGNLTSQMFANLFLNEVDQYIKHELRVKYYIRYMDDMMIICNDKKQLWEYKQKIESFLSTLKLNLNSKTCVRTIKQGVEFCGYRVWPHKVLLKRKTKIKMFRRLNMRCKQLSKNEIDYDSYNSSLQSYLGIVKHCSDTGLKERLLNKGG